MGRAWAKNMYYHSGLLAGQISSIDFKINVEDTTPVVVMPDPVIPPVVIDPVVIDPVVVDGTVLPGAGRDFLAGILRTLTEND